MSRAVPANANHRVPEHARTETARTLAATPGIRGEPTDAERGRTLLDESGGWLQLRSI